MERRYLIGGNWKLQLNTLDEVKKTWREIEESMVKGVDAFIALPPAFLYQVKGEKISVGAQNFHYDTKGAYTGETSVLTLVDAGVKFALIGHSERRIVFRETDEEINKKVLLGLQNGLQVVLCIGETARQRNNGDHEDVLRTQLQIALKGVQSLENVEIAYEPVWAINSPALNPGVEVKAATPKDAQETHKMIRDFIVEMYNEETAQNQRIIYGGSMKPENAEQLLSQNDIDGGLIGGASLTSDKFGAILKTATRLPY